MSNQPLDSSDLRLSQARRSLYAFILTLLAIEFLDELVFGAREAAWPLIRDELKLSYREIGLLLSLPRIIAGFIEPVLGVLGDIWQRRILILGGGMLFTLALILIALSSNFWVLLVALILLSPASGAFVGLSQAALMDAEPVRLEQNMARWTCAGSLGNVGGSLLLALFAGYALNWHLIFFALALLSLMIVAKSWREPRITSTTQIHSGETVNTAPENTAAASLSLNTVSAGLWQALQAMRNRRVARWLVLLVFSDLMLDLLRGFLALYFVDVVGTSETEAAFAVLIWTVVGLAGDILLIPLLERVRGLSYLRVSALATLLLFSLFLLLPAISAKLVLLGLLGILNAGWYSILKAQLYGALPGQSGMVMTIGSLLSIVDGLLPLSLGIIASKYGLAATMPLLLLGPLALLIGIPRAQR